MNSQPPRCAKALLVAAPLAFLSLPALFAADGDLLAWKKIFFCPGGTVPWSASVP